MVITISKGNRKIMLQINAIRKPFSFLSIRKKCQISPSRPVSTAKMIAKVKYGPANEEKENSNKRKYRKMLVTEPQLCRQKTIQ